MIRRAARGDKRTSPGVSRPGGFRFVSFRSAVGVGASNETKQNEKTKPNENESPQPQSKASFVEFAPDLTGEPGKPTPPLANCANEFTAFGTDRMM
jgi:hypothetical protein